MDQETDLAEELRRQVAATAATWSAAQSISFSVDLVAASLRLRQLLSTVDRHHCLYSRPAVSRAIQRYEKCWLPLLAEHANSAIVPPLDCAWIWYCHRLNPLAYARDCELLFGRLLAAPQLQTSATSHGDAVRCCQRLWEQRIPHEPFDLDLACSDDLVEQTSDLHESLIQYDLQSAVRRQSRFYYQIAEPHMGDERYLRAAEQRYKGFLYLFKMTACEAFLVPTYDVDLMWHAHQLYPIEYAHDTKTILGKVLQHDDTDSDKGRPSQKFVAGFRQTSKIWFESYGSVYQRAGAANRGDPPRPIDWITEMEEDYVDEQEPPFNYAPASAAVREVMKVHLSVVGARNIPSTQKGTLRVRLQFPNKCSALKLDTPSVPVSSSLQRQQVWWNQSWSFEAETSTEGFFLELRLKPSNLIKRIANCGNSTVILCRVNFTWKTILESPKLSWDGWVHCSDDKKSDATYLFVSVSVTPPVVAPQLFRSINPIVTNDAGEIDSFPHHVLARRKGCWLTRTLVDHANSEVFIVRLSYSDGHGRRTPEAEKRIHIHRGGWIRSRERNYRPAISTLADLPFPVASAEQMVNAQEPAQVLSNERRWGFSRNSSHLIVRRPMTDPDIIVAPLFLQICGTLASKVRLVPGRKLEYEVKGATAVEEEGFVTVIRHHPSRGTYASALFNWKTGAMEVLLDESVVLVLLLSSIISAAVFDMDRVNAMANKRANLVVKLTANGVDKKGTKTSGDEWGSVTFRKIHWLQTAMVASPYICWWEVGEKEYYDRHNAALIEASGCMAAGEWGDVVASSAELCCFDGGEGCDDGDCGGGDGDDGGGDDGGDGGGDIGGDCGGCGGCGG